MRCPYCKKEYTFLEEIYREICNEVHSIASLSKKLDIRRSTLTYYLDILKDKGRIKFRRLKYFTGRPQIIESLKGRKK